MRRRASSCSASYQVFTSFVVSDTPGSPPPTPTRIRSGLTTKKLAGRPAAMALPRKFTLRKLARATGLALFGLSVASRAAERKSADVYSAGLPACAAGAPLRNERVIGSEGVPVFGPK